MKGYINLELGGKKRGVKFGNRALLDLIAKGKIGEKVEFSLEFIADLVFAGLNNNCIIKKEDPDFTFDDVLVWIDDVPFSDMMGVFEVFQSSYQLEGKGKSKTTKK